MWWLFSLFTHLAFLCICCSCLASGSASLSLSCVPCNHAASFCSCDFSFYAGFASLCSCLHLSRVSHRLTDDYPLFISTCQFYLILCFILYSQAICYGHTHTHRHVRQLAPLLLSLFLFLAMSALFAFSLVAWYFTLW